MMRGKGEDTMTPHITGANLAGILITASVSVLALGMGAAAHFGWGAPSAEAQQAEVTKCQDAVQAVQQYHAPGDTFSVLNHVQVGMAVEPRPVQIAGWPPPSVGRDFCLVTFRATIGNTSQTYTWLYDLKTHRVEARDDVTKRLSGW